MKRRILPVGQGAFYCESFECGKNIVYDCGNANMLSVLSDCIDKNFCKNEDIEAIFISHLHYDHISGLKYLLSHCKVKRIYLPFLTPKGLVLIKLYYEYQKNEDAFVQKFLDNPKNAINYLYDTGNEFKDKEKPKIIFVRASNERHYDIDLDDNNSWTEKMCDSVINSGTDVANDLDVQKEFWKYIPYNLRNDIYLAEIEKNCKATFGKNWYNTILNKNICDCLIKNGKHGIKIVDIFKKIFKSNDFNIYSLTLLSVPCEKHDIMQIPCSSFLKNTDLNNSCCSHYGHKCYDIDCDCSFKYCSTYKKPGCLYTGDFDCSNNWKLLYNAYSKYWDEIGCFQIPHHGSKHSFNDNIIAMNSFFFLSAGLKNQYRHPSPSVIYSIYCSGSFFQWVNEKPDSQICFICCI